MGGMRRPSRRRAWIEIDIVDTAGAWDDGRPSRRRAWIEMDYGDLFSFETDGRPSRRRAWIEISGHYFFKKFVTSPFAQKGVD